VEGATPVTPRLVIANLSYNDLARRAKHSLTESALSPFQAEPTHYLHRYLWQFDFIWNNRGLNDGERTTRLIQVTEGKRLMYKAPLLNKQENQGEGQSSNS